MDGITPVDKVKKFSNKKSTGPKIEELNLSNNALGPSGAQSISNFLSKAGSLKKLLISHCDLKPAGAETIADAILANS